MADVNITYETLYEILRNEKNREDIQELSITFYEDVVSYLRKNKEMLDEAIRHSDSEEDKEDLLRQLKNIKMLIKEIYERREKKIINLALNQSRTKSESMEIDTLLVQERELYDRLVEVMDCFRHNILTRTLVGKTPIANQKTCAVDFREKDDNTMTGQDRALGKDKQKENLISAGKKIEDTISHGSKPILDEKNKTEEKQQIKPNYGMSAEMKTKEDIDEEEEQRKEEENEENINPEEEYKDKKKLKFKEIVPKFLGKELEVYGPFDSDDVASLPTELANILIRKGKAEEII